MKNVIVVKGKRIICKLIYVSLKEVKPPDFLEEYRLI